MVGRNTPPLSSDEWEQVFEAVSSGPGEGTLKKLREQLFHRHRTTVVKAYNTVRQFALHRPKHMDDAAAKQVVTSVGYETTLRYVQDTFTRWRAWSEGRDRTRLRHRSTDHDRAVIRELRKSRVATQQMAEGLRGIEEELRKLRRQWSAPRTLSLGSADVHTDTTLMELTTVWTGRPRSPKPGWDWEHSRGARGTLTLYIEDDPIFQMLREHLADRSFGRLFDEWKRSVEYLLWLCRELSSEMTLVCQQQTGATVLKAGARSRNTLFWEFSRQVYRRQLLRAEGRGEGPHLEYEFAQSGDLWVLKLGNRRLAVHPDRSALSRWRDTHGDLVASAAWSRAIEDILRQHQEVRSRSRELHAALRGLS